MIILYIFAQFIYFLKTLFHLDFKINKYVIEHNILQTESDQWGLIYWSSLAYMLQSVNSFINTSTINIKHNSSINIAIFFVILVTVILPKGNIRWSYFYVSVSFFPFFFNILAWHILTQVKFSSPQKLPLFLWWPFFLVYMLNLSKIPIKYFLNSILWLRSLCSLSGIKNSKNLPEIASASQGGILSVCRICLTIVC